MEEYWRLDTHGDPLGAFRLFLAELWQTARLDGLLAPADGDSLLETRLRLMRQPAELADVNPFRPLMTHSAARRIPALVAENERHTLGALLRPCEMTSLIEMAKRGTFSTDRLVTVCVDCLATLPVDEYAWRARRREHGDALAEEALHFAGRGGIVPYRYRSACQMCRSSEARMADVNIGVLGASVRQELLIYAGDGDRSGRVRLEPLSDGPAPESAVAERREVLTHLSERQARARERITAGLAAGLPASAEEVGQLLAGCGGCQACIGACPTAAVEAPLPQENGTYDVREVSRWLISCAGCGMCEQACPALLPLAAVYGAVRDQLARATGYVPGRSMAEPLPI